MLARVTRLRFPMLILAVVVALIPGCKKSVPEDLAQAKDVLAGKLEPLELHNSMFSAAYPECKPSEYVHFLFSTIGAAEMPAEDQSAPEEDRGNAPGIGRVSWPTGVALIAMNPDPQQRRQVVLKPDDEHGILVIEAYEDPANEPVGRFEISVPKVTPSDMAKIAFHSHVEMGGTY